MLLRHVLAFTFIGLLALSGAGPAAAQNWPTRPVTMVVPFPPGGGTDVLGRIVAQKLSETLGQQVIVENLGGAGGMIGSARVAHATPDGYQFVVGSRADAINQTLYKHPLYDFKRDLAPVILVADQPMIIIARKDLPVSGLQDFIAYVKKNQATLRTGSAGIGSTGYVDCALFNQAIGVKVQDIPYRGGGPALGDVVAGHVPIMFGDIGPVTGLVREGRVKALGVTVGKRVETIPEVPTLVEAGLAGYEANSWQSLVAPANVPSPIVTALNKALTAFLAEPATRSHFVQLGMQPMSSTPQEFAIYLRAEIAKWAPIINAAGATED